MHSSPDPLLSSLMMDTGLDSGTIELPEIEGQESTATPTVDKTLPGRGQDIPSGQVLNT